MDSGFEAATERLRQCGLRPTRQRVGLVALLFGDGHRHVTAEQLHQEAARAGLTVSLATVYNTLHEFTRVGLLHQIVVEPGQTWFDNNNDAHHHFYYAESGRLEDIEGDRIMVTGLPPVPKGASVQAVQVIIRLQEDSTS